MNNQQKILQKEEVKEIIIGAVIFIVLVSTFYIVLPTTLNTDVPLAYVSSGSMEPTYYVGDLVVIKGVKGEDINVGDVIVFQPPGHNELIFHRVVAKKFENGQYYFLTKGDNPVTNKYIDTEWGWVPESRVHGKMIFRIPLLGFVFMFISTIIGKIFIIFLAALILFYDYIFGDEEQTKPPEYRFLGLNKKVIGSLLLLIVIISVLVIAFSSYIYIGNERPEVDFTGLGTPIQDYGYNIYPAYFKVRSFGLTKGTVKAFYITPTRKDTNSSAPTVVWTISYPFIGEKEICLPIFIPLNSSVGEYKLFLSIKVESFDKGSFFINETIENL
ncbi:MAG: signal peptidase I [Candidatus Njordarchaeia archaeon]